MGVFTATRYVASLPQVSIDWLVGEGVSLVLLDRDNTCVPRDTRRVPAEVTAWLAEARSAGLTLCLVSNNFHSGQVRATADELGCEVVDHAMKPAPFALRRAMEMHGATPDKTVMIGDQVFTDVAARKPRRRPHRAGEAAVAPGPLVHADLPRLRASRPAQPPLRGRVS